jgi:hypothetical protein
MNMGSGNRHQAHTVSLKATGVDKVVIDDVTMYLDNNGSSWVSEDPCSGEFDTAHSNVVHKLKYTCRDSMKPSGSLNVPG